MLRVLPWPQSPGHSSPDLSRGCVTTPRDQPQRDNESAAAGAPAQQPPAPPSPNPQPDQAGLLSSPLLTHAGFRHAFFTRHGGVSAGPYRSLNFSYAATDSEANVRQNLARAGVALGVPATRLYFLSQVHGVEARTLHGNEDREQVLFEQGDAVVSLDPTLACGVRTADCVPILIADRTSGGVGAIHAGWRGTVSGVVAQAVSALRELIGAPGDLIAAIGPHISARAFEVSEQVAAELAACSKLPGVVQRAELASDGRVVQPYPKPHVDLRRIIRGQLLELGLTGTAIDDVPGCTVLDAEDFFSFRRDGAHSGRHLSAIVPRGS